MPNNKQKNNNRALFEGMSTEMLMDLLCQDAVLPEGECLDADTIAQITEILASREECQTYRPDVDAAWDSFQQNYLTPDFDGTPLYSGEEEQEKVQKAPPAPQRRAKKARPRRVRALIAAAAMLAVLFTGTVASYAFGFDLWGVVATWGSETFQFEEAPGRVVPEPLKELAENLEVYGLMDRDLLPTWLPEGYELLGTQFDEMSSYTYFSAMLERGESRMTISYQLYFGENTDIAYEKDGGDPEEYVAGGQLHYIMTNAGKYLCVWINDHVECFISGADSREDLIQIIDSIYTEEGD